MLIGVPKEIKNHEYRVGLTPSSVRELTSAGHRVIVERNAYKQAGEVLNKSEKQLKQALTQLGRAMNGPWRADDKLACLAAWLALG